MRSSTIYLVCGLLAMCLSYVPSTEGVACTAPDTPTGCTDCSVSTNASDPDCTTTAPTTTTSTTVASDSSTTSTTAASSTDTTTKSSSSKAKKIRRKHKYTRVIKGGKKIIKRHHKGVQSKSKWASLF